MNNQNGKGGFGFKALLATQFLGAFNDNAFKFVIAMIAVNRFADHAGGTKYVSLAGAALIIPFILFSTFAGFLADRFSKRRVIIATKVAELFVMGAGLFALLKGNMWGMLAVMFVMGTQSAFFSPSKYGILPEILDDEDLSIGNGLIQMWTNIAIILGTACGGYLIYITKPDIYRTAYYFMGVSLVGIATSLFVTRVKPSGSRRPIELNILKEFVSNVKELKKDRAIFLSVMGLAYFGFLGALFQMNILLYARKMMMIDEFQTSILLVVLALGIGAGAYLAGRFSEGKIELGLVPFGSLGLTVFSICLGVVYASFAKVSVCLFLVGMSAGFFVVPLNALIQHNAPADERGKVLATNNILSFSAMLIGSLALYVFRDLLLINSAQIFIIAGIITIIGTTYITSLLPYAFIRFIIWILAHTLYRLKVINKTNIPDQGGALLASNHVSYLDAVLLVVASQRPVRFMVHREIYTIKWLKWLMNIARVIPVSGMDKPKEIIRSLETAKAYLREGELVCIFPEGGLTRTGNILKFNQGLERIMRDVDCPIIPVHLDRVWGSIFSFERGKYFFKLPKTIPYPVTISFGEAMPAKSSAFEVRNRVMELGADSFPYRISEKLTLPEAFWKEARKHPFRFCMADTSGKRINYGQSLGVSVALAASLKAILKKEQKIGILIPPSIGGVLSNVAVAILNKVPVNLNYTASREAMRSVIEQCKMTTVITSRAFIEKTKMEVPVRTIFIEDVIKKLNPLQKGAAFVKAFLFPSLLSRLLIFGSRKYRSMDHLATIMFTSGSTGEPKGVMLTHANITSNLEGLYQIFRVNKEDKLLGILPLFHSFGFTATMWFPLITGTGAVYHVNPLDAKMIGKLVKKYRATIMMSTPTFLNSYIRRCEAEQFTSLRVVVVGAEKLKGQVATQFKEKFGIDPMEGYGCTELSPIVSLNLPDYRAPGVKQKAFKPGKIGLPLPGIAVKIVDQETGAPAGPDENGVLFIKGPNVMQGYLNKPELTGEVIRDGWYTTGDVANMDEDGFIMITDRLSRFSKIAGEMVPHIKIEEKIHEILNVSEQNCVITSIADDKKGERLAGVILKDIDAFSLVEELKTSGLPNLWVPDARDLVQVEAIPLLGSGKLDLGKIKQVVNEAVVKGEDA